MKILLTGASGFIGSWLAEEILANDPTTELYSVERITPRPLMATSYSIKHIYHDFCSPIPNRILKELQGVNYIIHCGAEVHGLRSLENPESFVQANVTGTLNILEAARVLKPTTFVYISSAEVVGSVAKGSLDEDAPLKPSNPYSAAKAAAEMLVKSYHSSFLVPTIIIRTMNVFGERQDSSKFIPQTIKKMLAGQPISLHVDSDGKSGSRHWLYVGEFVAAVYSIMTSSFVTGATYHIVGPEKANAAIISYIGHSLGIPWIQHPSLPGASHDMRYSIKDNKVYHRYDGSNSKMISDLEKTVRAYKENQEWLR